MSFEAHGHFCTIPEKWLVLKYFDGRIKILDSNLHIRESNMSGTDIKRVGDAIKDATDAIGKKADELHGKINQLRDRTLDRFHTVESLTDDWDKQLMLLDEMVGAKTNGPPTG